MLIAFHNALWQLLNAPNFEEGVIDTVMQGGDIDTVMQGGDTDTNAANWVQCTAWKPYPING